MKTTSFQLSISILTLLFFIPLLASAHSVGFANLTEETEEGRVVDFGYEEATMIEGVPTRMSFELYDEAGTTTMSSFTEVWIVIKGEAGTIYSGGLDRPEFGETGITFTYPEAGAYTVSARFQENNAILANATFELSVAESQRNSEGSKATPMVIGAIALVIGFFLGRFLAHKSD